MLEKENEKQVRTSTGEPLKMKDMPRDKRVKYVCTYADIVYTRNLSNKIEK